MLIKHIFNLPVILTLLLLNFGSGLQYIGFISDVHLDPELMRHLINEAWRSSDIQTKTSKWFETNQIENIDILGDIEVADLTDPADTLNKICQVTAEKPVMLIALSQCGCSGNLAYFSSALKLPIYELSLNSKKQCACESNLPMRDDYRIPVGRVPVSDAPRELLANPIRTRQSKYNNKLLGKFLSCNLWKKTLIFFDHKKNLQSIASIINEMGNQMHRVTIQKLPLTLTGSLNVDKALPLAKDIISRAVDEIWESSSEELPYYLQRTSKDIALILIASESTVRNFILQMIPEFQLNIRMQYYLVDLEWKNDHFMQSLVFRNDITVVTSSHTYQFSSKRNDQEIDNEASKRKLQRSFNIIARVFETATSIGMNLSKNKSSSTCVNFTTNFANQSIWLAQAIKDELNNNDANDTNRSRATQEKRLAPIHPYYITQLPGTSENTSSVLQFCDVMNDGKIHCTSLLDQTRISESKHQCRKAKVIERPDSHSHVSVGSPLHSMIKDKFDLFTQYGVKLKNKTYKVATLEDEPFVFVNKDAEGHARFSGFSIDLLHLLSEIFDFKYEVYQVEDRKYGAFKNGKWNGLVGDVVSKKADLAIAAMTITPQREKVVDFTKRYMDYAVGILIKRPKTVANLFAFLNPFEKTVWYSIIAGLFLVSLLLYVLNRVSPRRITSLPYRDDSLHGAFWFVYSSLVQQGTEMSLITLSSQIVTGVWWFFILIIISSYTANLAAHLTVTRMETSIASFRDLSLQTDIIYGTARDTSIYDFLRTKGTNGQDNNAMWSKLWKIVNGSNSVSDPKEGFLRVKEENYAFLWDVAVIEYLMLTDSECAYSTIADSIYDKGYGIALQQGDPTREAFSMGILQLQDRGEINKLKQRWWRSAGKCPTETNRKRKHSNELTMDNFAGVFCVLACGLVIASLVAVVELIQHLKRGKKTALKDFNKPAMKRPSILHQRAVVEKCIDDEVHIILQNSKETNRFPIESCLTQQNHHVHATAVRAKRNFNGRGKKMNGQNMIDKQTLGGEMDFEMQLT